MRRDHIEFQEHSAPLAFLITIRTYGTWLHGDKRGSMDRREYNRYGEPKIEERPTMQLLERKLMKAPRFLLDASSRSAVETAIRNVCSFREFTLRAIHIRTNHAHTVVSAARSPVLVMNSFKSYATRKLRSEGLVAAGTKVWSRHGSTRYLWTERHIETAVEYVVLGQGDELPTFD